MNANDTVSGALGTEPPEHMAEMVEHARDASRFLKGLAHEGRLIILCTLVEGEKSVSELGAILGADQPIVSQQLARLRADDLVSTRRWGKKIYYSLASAEVRQVVELLYRLFCEKSTSDDAAI